MSGHVLRLVNVDAAGSLGTDAAEEKVAPGFSSRSHGEVRAFGSSTMRSPAAPLHLPVTSDRGTVNW